MTYGELLGYRLRYGVKETELREELLKETSHRIKNLGRSLKITWLALIFCTTLFYEYYTSFFFFFQAM